MKWVGGHGTLTKRKPFQEETLSLNSGGLDGTAGHLGGADRSLWENSEGYREQTTSNALRWERETGHGQTQEQLGEAGIKGKGGLLSKALSGISNLAREVSGNDASSNLLL